MKSLRVSNLAAIRNELQKYKKGRKLDIRQFNQLARLAWLGRVVLQPLDPEDPECEAALVYVQEPDELAGHFLDPDPDLVGRMHILDGAQARALVRILEQGVRERAKLYESLARRDFYFAHFFEGAADAEPERSGGQAQGAGEEGPR